ncbi:DNA helicase [Aestuariibius sp. 2305UL40-4]|uniref:DNA helicase n=1 Tax=Aestuariibius violaceus TaxID=3234132 RepID=UPI00345EA9C7
MRLSAPIFRLKRQARVMAREEGVPLHVALDRIAVAEGFRAWSHLASASGQRPAERVLAELEPADMVLLGARPGHGKTLLGLEIAALAPRLGRTGFFFSLEYNERDVTDRFGALGVAGEAVILDMSDEICAAYVLDRLGSAGGQALVVVDYLQLLDQRRANPGLAEQLGELKAYAARAGAIFVLISQIDRAFEGRGAVCPGPGDIRMPNPFDLRLFDRMCFLHDGRLAMEAA